MTYQQPGGGVNLGKVTLSKAEPSVSLTKPGDRQGVMRVNLNWSQGVKRGLFRRSNAVDLDLGCLWELTDGRKGVIQALGNSFGQLQQPPFILLDGDDRTGQAAGGENMHINLDQPGIFRRVLIFAYIYEGVPNWASADGVVTLYPTAGPQVEVRLDSPVNDARSCAVALLENIGGGLQVRREVQYINGSQSAIDKAYNWGLNWTPGRK